jgi:hypothetical protein
MGQVNLYQSSPGGDADADIHVLCEAMITTERRGMP